MKSSRGKASAAPEPPASSLTHALVPSADSDKRYVCGLKLASDLLEAIQAYPDDVRISISGDPKIQQKNVISVNGQQWVFENHPEERVDCYTQVDDEFVEVGAVRRKMIVKNTLTHSERMKNKRRLQDADDAKQSHHINADHDEETLKGMAARPMRSSATATALKQRRVSGAAAPGSAPAAKADPWHTAVATGKHKIRKVMAHHLAIAPMRPDRLQRTYASTSETWKSVLNSLAEHRAPGVYYLLQSEYAKLDLDFPLYSESERATVREKCLKDSAHGATTSDVETPTKPPPPPPAAAAALPARAPAVRPNGITTSKVGGAKDKRLRTSGKLLTSDEKVSLQSLMAGVGRHSENGSLGIDSDDKYRSYTKYYVRNYEHYLVIHRKLEENEETFKALGEKFNSANSDGMRNAHQKMIMSVYESRKDEVTQLNSWYASLHAELTEIKAALKAYAATKKPPGVLNGAS